MLQRIPPLAVVLAVALFPAPEGARAQVLPCTPTLSVSAEPDENGVYTTTLTCADTSADAGDPDYEHVYYNQAATALSSPANNNNWNNHVVLTIGSGLVFSAGGHIDFREPGVDINSVLHVINGSDKTIEVEEGAVLYLRRTPEYYCQTESYCTPERQAARPAMATPSFDPAWYRSHLDVLDRLAGIWIQAITGDATVRFDGTMELAVDVRGTFENWHSNGNAISVIVDDTDSSEARADHDAIISLGSSAVIRQAEGFNGVNGIYVDNRTEDGDIRIDLAAGSLIDVTTAGGRGLNAWIYSIANTQSPQTGDIFINAAGTVRAALRHGLTLNALQGVGISAFHSSDGRIRIDSSGTIETWQSNAILMKARGGGHRDDPATAEIEGHLIDVTGGKVHTRGGTAVYAEIFGADGDAAVTVRVARGATVRAELDAGPDAITQEQLGADGGRYILLNNVYGWREIDADGDGENDALEPIVNAIAVGRSAAASEGATDRVIVDGTVEAVGGKEGVDSAVFMIGGGAVSVGATGRVFADSGLAISSGSAPPEALPEGWEEPESDLEVTVAGTVEGDIRVLDAGALTFASLAGSTVAGTVHDPEGPLTVAGSVGRLLYSNGGTVTVAATGKLTGVGGVALRSDAGALDVTVAGSVAGDLRPPTGGTLKLAVLEGGEAPGTVHDPEGPLTVAGDIGRLLYSNGGTVTVAATGEITGVEGVAIRSEAGDLDATVAGMATGDILGLGEGDRTVTVSPGGTVAGTIRSEVGDLSVTVAGRVSGDIRATDGGALTLSVPEGGTVAGTAHDPAGSLTVAGSVGRLLYSDGGTVAVAPTGWLTGIDGVAIRSEAGDLDATVAGMATGDILGLGEGDHTVTVARGGTVTGTIRLAASTVRVDGSAGCVRLDKGGMVTVGATGRIACADGAGVRSETGDLTATVAGAVTGDVVARGRGEHRVSVAAGARVTGVVRTAAAGSAVVVAGTVDKVRLDNGGAVTLEATGRIPGIDGVSVESRSGAPAVTIVRATGESLSDAADRIGGAIVAHKGDPSVMFRREGETAVTAGRFGTARAAPAGAYDVGLEPTAAGGFDVVERLAARARVYEALPSVLLGMARPASHAERAAAPRASNGAWARVDASQGSWKAASSTNAGIEYDRRGFSFQAGVDAVLSEKARAGVSVHGRRATAEVSQGGDVEARGAGLGLSATWSSGPVFVDGQTTATLYDLDLTSSVRGALKDDARAHGLSAALEAGRTVPAADGVTVTPRARVAYSSLSLSDFDDSVGARVSLDRGRSLTGRAGALAEFVFDEGRVFGSLDVEHEFEAETRMSVAGTSLAAEGEETRWLAGVGAERGWDDGRFALRAALGYAGSGGGETHDYGGNASLSVRF